MTARVALEAGLGAPSRKTKSQTQLLLDRKRLIDFAKRG
jgi:hypothetical protein